MKLSTNKKELGSDEAITLWSKVGWGNTDDYNQGKVKKAINNTFYVVFVRNQEGQLVGLTRVIGDGVLHMNIADIVVDPDYRKRGIGALMLSQIKKDLKDSAVYLESLPGNEKFFQASGYKIKKEMQVFTHK